MTGPMIALLHCGIGRAEGSVLLPPDLGKDEARIVKLISRIQKTIQDCSGDILRSYDTGVLAQFGDPLVAYQCAAYIKTMMQVGAAGARDGLGMSLSLHAVREDQAGVRIQSRDFMVLAQLNEVAGSNDIVATVDFRDLLSDGVDAVFQDLGDFQLKYMPVPVRSYRLEDISNVEAPIPLELHDQRLPTIAVLPFTMASGEDFYGAVGDLLAERIVDKLAKSRHVTLISRMTGKAFAGKQHAPEVIAEAIQSDYVLRGQYFVLGPAFGGRLRLDAQLYDRLGQCVWSDNVEGSVGDLLSHEGELAYDVASNVHHVVVEREVDYSAQQQISSLNNYSMLLSGIVLMHRSAGQQFMRSRSVLEALIDRDSDLGIAHAWIAKWYVLSTTRAMSLPNAHAADDALAHAMRAQSSQDSKALAMAMEGFVRLHMKRDFQQAASLFVQAESVNPNEPFSWLFDGVLNAFQGDAQRAWASSQRAMSLSPLDPLLYYFESLGASSALAIESYDMAVRLCERSLRRNLTHLHTHRALVTAHYFDGQISRAKDAAKTLLRIAPGYTVNDFLSHSVSADTKFGRRMAEALSAAGVPK